MKARRNHICCSLVNVTLRRIFFLGGLSENTSLLHWWRCLISMEPARHHEHSNLLCWGGFIAPKNTLGVIEKNKPILFPPNSPSFSQQYRRTKDICKQPHKENLSNCLVLVIFTLKLSHPLENIFQMLHKSSQPPPLHSFQSDTKLHALCRDSCFSYLCFVLANLVA